MKYKPALWLVHLVVTLLLIICYVFIGPYMLQFNGAEIFFNTIAEFAFPILLLLIWAVCHLKVKNLSSKKAIPEIKKNDDAKTTDGVKVNDSPKIKIFPLKFWFKHFPDSKNKPIILLSEQSQSDKSSLLSPLGLPIDNMVYEQVNWYLFHDFIIIEFPACDNLGLWSSVLSTLKSSRNKLIALVFCISLQHAKETLHNSFKFAGQQLFEFESTMKRNINTYLVLNHLGCLTGFSQFLQSLNDEQKKQPFSFYSKEREINNWVNDLYHQINQQGKNFQDQRIIQMELFPLLDDRRKLYEFSERFVKISFYIKKGLELLLKKWSGFDAIQGVYFCSLSGTDSQQCYFFSTFWLHVLKQANQNKILLTEHLKKYNYKTRIYFYCILVMISVFFSIVWTRNFLTSKFLLDGMRTQVSSSSSISFEEITAWRDRIYFINKLTPALRVGTALKDEVDFLYNHHLSEKTNPILEEWFSINLSKEPDIDLYNNLRAYLMLGNLSRRNVDILQTWIKHHPDLIEKKLFDPYLANNLTLQLNKKLISDARKKLLSLPNGGIDYLIFMDYVYNSETNRPLFTLGDINKISQDFQLNISNLNIPTIYTKNWFLSKYNIAYKQYYEQIKEYYWVVYPYKVINKTDELEQYNTMISFYFNDYKNIWNKNYENLKLTEFNTLQKMSEALGLLSEQNSVFDILLDKLSYNTDYDTDLSKKNDFLHLIHAEQNNSPARAILNPTFERIINFLKTNKSDPMGLDYNKIKINLQSLSQELAKISSLQDNSQEIAAFVKVNLSGGANNVYQTLKQQLPSIPQPLQGWVQQLLDQIWQLVVISVNQQLQMLWQQQVMDFYNAAINYRFPIDLEAGQSITLNDFNNFYKPGGIISKFYQQYLENYLGNVNATPSLPNSISPNIGLNASMLSELKNAQLIQQAFFDGTDKANISFSLKPYLLSSNVAQVSLILAGKKLTYGHGPIRETTFSWPGNNQNYAINWIDLNGHEYSTTIQDAWGLFRLLQQATIQPMGDNLLVTFKQDNFIASFIVNVDSAFNPFTLFSSESSNI